MGSAILAIASLIVILMLMIICNVAVRRLWRDYYMAADAIVFLIDASNRERFDEARKELHVRICCHEILARK